MDEWFKSHAWKACSGLYLTRVRIPLLPPYVPNSAFCFIKTNNSFHGVEQLEMEDTDRWSLQYNVHITKEILEQEKEARDAQ